MLSDKKLEKIEKVLGEEILGELQAQDAKTLHLSVVLSEQNIKTAIEELEANPQYQEIKENLKALSAGLKDVKKFQNAKIQYVLHLLEGKTND